MRWNTRTIAALVAIALGLLLVGAVVYSLLVDSPQSPVYRGDDTEKVVAGRLDPIDPGGSNPGKLRTSGPGSADGPDKWAAFSTEYGDRGEHEVTVSVRGSATSYTALWRDHHEEKGAAKGGYTKTRTVKGGFPLVTVAILSFSGQASCTITIDGIEKETKSVGTGGYDWCIG